MLLLVFTEPQETHSLHLCESHPTNFPFNLVSQVQSGKYVCDIFSMLEFGHHCKLWVAWSKKCEQWISVVPPRLMWFWVLASEVSNRYFWGSPVYTRCGCVLRVDTVPTGRTWQHEKRLTPVKMEVVCKPSVDIKPWKRQTDTLTFVPKLSMDYFH